MNVTARERPLGSCDPELFARPWEGRAFGGIVLAAFLLYGIGSAWADQPVGMTLIVINSIAVACAGLIGFRLLRVSDLSVGIAYFVARSAEALLLVGGIALAEHGGLRDADTTGYLLAMIALGAGSIAFCQALGKRRWIPRTLAIWGTYGYAALAVGALVELVTGSAVTVVFAIPGGLFEIALGLYLVRHGFSRTTAHSRQCTQ